ncbi:peptidase S58 family protein [Oleomonas cavernae]|uniref:Peptidase S58 family protein n=1 Tax=Oleomonas cavernae TaxID=2320859 RepID=A0A418WGQ3_9PROT|nr:P1 family peptidase [Oleomonas cavernae]RJF89226.1 peptidase S58 family protein [Oleomonas cavernae]
MSAPPSPRPGPRNLITDVAGLRVGNAQDQGARTGVTVVLPDGPVVMAVDQRGGAPGTRETDALDPVNFLQEFHAVVLSGGSVFGLAAADGVVAELSARGVGLKLPSAPMAIPVVPSAILYDLGNGGDKAWGVVPPYRRLGFEALGRVDHDFALGNVGAGLGAACGRLKGGLGSASVVIDGIEVGALVAVNAVGSATMPGSPVFWAWPFEWGDEFGGVRPSAADLARPPAYDLPEEGKLILAGHTTIAVVATNVALDKAQATRFAIMAQDGLARALRPAHTPFDGDTVFAISTGRRQLDTPAPLGIARLGHLAAECLARATARGVYAAATLGALKSYREAWGR